MQNRDSLLQLFQKWGVHEQYPQIAERLAVEDVILPDLRRAVQLIELVEKDRRQPTSLITPTTAENNLSFIDKYKSAMLRSIPGRGPPDVIRARYEGLNDIEAKLAYQEFALSAKVASSESYPDLTCMLDDLSNKAHMKCPRLIVLDSDIPVAFASGGKGTEPVIFISTNEIDIQNNRQLGSLLAHELWHIRRRGNLVSAIVDDFRRVDNNYRIKEEYRADAFNVALGVSAGDFADSMTAMLERIDQLRKFKRSYKAVISDCEPLEWFHSGLPSLFVKFSQSIGNFPNMFGLHDSDSRTDPLEPSDHPPTMSRFDNLTDIEDARAKKSRS